MFDMENFNINDYKIGFIGGGNMATAIATGLLRRGKQSKIYFTFIH